MTAKLVQVDREGKVAVLTLQRPEKLNALSTAVERELMSALTTEEVRGSAAVVLTGSGRSFSSGADVSEFTARDTAAVLAYYRETGDVCERVAELPQPTISAIFGYCLGGGLDLALATDLRVADETAVFGLPEVELGILPSTYRLVRLVGPGRAKELILARPRLSASEAHALGLVTEVVPAGGAVERALELAERLAALPPLAVSLAKATVDRMPESSRETGILIERLAYGMLAQTADAREAAEAFAEKREPRFRGR